MIRKKMAEKEKKKERPPAEPALLSPRREEVVDGSKVLFQWESVEGAQEYRLVVARDASFEELVFTEKVGNTTQHEVSDVFEADGRTYFWHVEAHNEHGDSGREVVESFVAATADEAATMRESPESNDDEDYGPAGELVRAASAEMAAEVTGSEKYYEEEERLGVEHEGIEAGQIMGIAGGVIVAIILIIITLLMVVDLEAAEQREAVMDASRYPELQETEAQAMEKLHQYGVVEGEEGVYRIPIDRAMQIIANEAYQEEGTTPEGESSLDSEN